MAEIDARLRKGSLHFLNSINRKKMTYEVLEILTTFLCLRGTED